MNSSRGGGGGSHSLSNQPTTLNTHLLQSPQIQTTLLSQGSISKRSNPNHHHRPDWNKATSIISQKPFNQNRSIDNRQGFAIIQKKIDLNTSGNPTSISANNFHHQLTLQSFSSSQEGTKNQQFLYNSYQNHQQQEYQQQQNNFNQTCSNNYHDGQSQSNQPNLLSTAKSSQSHDTVKNRSQMLSAKNNNWLNNNISGQTTVKYGNALAVQNINRLSSHQHHSTTPSNNFLNYQMNSNHHQLNSRSNDKISIQSNSLVNTNFRSQKQSQNQSNVTSNKTIQSSNSSKNLMLDSAILNTLNQQQSCKSEVLTSKLDGSCHSLRDYNKVSNLNLEQETSEQQYQHQTMDQFNERNRIFNELSNNLETLRAYRIEGSKQTQKLTNALSSFTPVQSQRNGDQQQKHFINNSSNSIGNNGLNSKQINATSHDKKSYLNSSGNGGGAVAKLKLNGKVSFDEIRLGKKLIGSQTVSSQTSKLNVLVNSQTKIQNLQENSQSKQENLNKETSSDEEESSDVNESIIIFKQSTHDTKSNNDQQTPMSLNSSKFQNHVSTDTMPQSENNNLPSVHSSDTRSQHTMQSQDISNQLLPIGDINILSVNKESRNKFHQVFMSQQMSSADNVNTLLHNEGSTTINGGNTLSDNRTEFNSDSIEHSQQQDSVKRKDSQNLNGRPKKGSSQKKPKGLKSGLKNGGKQAKNTNSSGIISLQSHQNGSKTPQEVFNYKLKGQTSYRIDNLIKGNGTSSSQTTISNLSQIPSSRKIQQFHQGSKKQSVSSVTVSNRQQVQAQITLEDSQKDIKLGSFQNKIEYVSNKPSTHQSIIKSESQKQIFFTQRGQSENIQSNQGFVNNEEIKNVYIDTTQNYNFIYSTLQNPTGRPSIPISSTQNDQQANNMSKVPPNSEQLVSPETYHPSNPLMPLIPNQNQQIKNDFQEKIKALDFELEQARDHKQEIKVVSRFRPYNSIEKELKEGYSAYQQKDNIINFLEDGKSLKVSESYTTSHSQNMIFTFDHIFKPEASQEEVFNTLGRETIEDIMEGYNGTIFAYGQTGSGKTYTMYGQDMFDEELMGLIPRAARQIFQHIKDKDLEIEYQIRVQMVEIYKEQLRDLLHDTPDHPPELKIKEDPKRGTYVEGLNSFCIVSEEEMMAVLCTGETMRHVASTNLNKVSSRSHSICIIEIVQKYPNDSERRGILNLVDLAGSERVSKSHAQGQALEEAKKINYSLSALGKVINCLTKNGSLHIPYRDSKLTRLLKESLGGNNKTSLIVACSLHHSNIEETISTLRFAQSAKFIKNKVKLNIKTSPEQLQLIIEQLKVELRSCKEEIHRLRITNSNSVGSATGAASSDGQTQQRQISASDQYYPGEEYADAHEFQEYRLFKPNGEQIDSDYFQSTNNQLQQQQHLQNQTVQDDNSDQQNQNQILLQQQQQDQQQVVVVGGQNQKENIIGKHTIHNRPHQSLLAKNYDVIETNNQRMQMLSLLTSEFSCIPATGTPAFISPVKNYEIKLMHLINRNEDLELKVRSKDKDIEALETQKDELQNKVLNMEEKMMGYKQKLVSLEKKVAEHESDKDFMLVNEVKQTSRMEDLNGQIEVLTSQIKCLECALEDSEQTCQILLKEKQTIYQKSIKDFLNETIKLKRIKVSDALDNFINKPQQFTSQQMKRSFISNLDLLADYKNQDNLVKQSEQLVQSLNEKDLLSRNLYCLETINALEDTPPELTIYLLKQMLIEASLANHNLQRILAVNRWRQVMEFGKNKIKSMQCKLMEGTIETLDQVLERTRKTHDKLRARVEKLENHLCDNRNYYGDMVLMTEANNVREHQNNPMVMAQSGVKTGFNIKNQILEGKTIIGFNSLKDKANNMNMHNQSIVSVIMHQSSNPHYNQKSRFVRTITNKTLGKVFNFMERSPVSRGSIGATNNNQSIISQYYGQRQHPNYKPGGTPLRTGGMNSPVIYNFQSPIRRQNTFIFTNANNNNKNGQINAHNNSKQVINQNCNKENTNVFALSSEQQPSQLQQNSNLLIYSNDSSSFKAEDQVNKPKLTKELLEQQERLIQQNNINQQQQQDTLIQQFTFQNNNYNTQQQQHQQSKVLLLSQSENSNLNGGAVSENMNGNTCVINNEQMTFEDAIVKFFNSSELEGKNAQRIHDGLTSDVKRGGEEDKQGQDNRDGGGVKLNHQDLLKIEGLNSLQEIKDYLRGKFERNPSMTHIDQLQNSASVHLNPLFSQYQNNAVYQHQNNSSNLQSSQVENNPQINSHTTNNNLYAQSNDFYDNQDPTNSKVAPCSSSGNYHDNQRQEHVMTLASEYMITSNSVIGPNGLFSGTGAQIGLCSAGGGVGYGGYGNNYHQNDYLDRLQEKIVQLQEEVDTQKCRAEEHKKAYYESKRQIDQMRDLMEDKESKHNSILKSEICQWENALNKFKEMNESELLKKQKEIEKIHQILAQWIENYQQLEHSKGVSNVQIEKLVAETMKHYRQKSGLLCEIMKSPHNRKRQSNTMQSFDSRIPKAQKNNYFRVNTEQNNYKMLPFNQTNMNPNVNQNKEFDKKRINGDNSPVAQEDSCYDIDQTSQIYILNQKNEYHFNYQPQRTLEPCEEHKREDTFPLQTYQSNDEDSIK